MAFPLRDNAVKCLMSISVRF